MADTKSTNDGGAAEVQKNLDAVQDKGYHLLTESLPDPTPLENYTVAGVTAGKPTPETDEAAAEKARKARG